MPMILAAGRIRARFGDECEAPKYPGLQIPIAEWHRPQKL